MSRFSGKYTAASVKTSSNNSLPDAILCSVCQMYRKEISFSNRQLDILKRKMHSEKRFAYGPKKKQQEHDEVQVRCRDCTAEPVSEMLCTHCDTHKDIDSFAKAQRKKPDNAKCLACMEVIAMADDDRHGDNTAVGTAYDDFSDDDSDDRSFIDDSLNTFDKTSIPWATYDDGDYVTENEITSGYALSKMGIDASNSSNTPSGPYSRLYHPSIGASSGRGSRAGTIGSGTHSNRGNAASSTRNDGYHDGNAFQARAGRDSTDRGSLPQQKTVPQNSDFTTNGRPFNAWGPQGQVATHYKTSTASMDSTQSNKSSKPGTYASATRRMAPSFDQSDNWPKIRPANNPPIAKRGDRFPKVRPQNHRNDIDNEHPSVSGTTSTAGNASEGKYRNSFW